MHRLHRGSRLFILTLTVRPLSYASSSSSLSAATSFVTALLHSRPPSQVPLSSSLPQQQQHYLLAMSSTAVANPYSNTTTTVGIIHADASLVQGCEFDITRTRLLTPRVPLPPKTKPKANSSGGTPCVIYWMIRDVRTQDNWALLFAQNIAKNIGLPLRVVYALPPPPDATATAEGENGSPPPKPSDMAMTARHGKFLLDGLKVVSNEFQEKGVQFTIFHPKRGRDHVGYDIYQDYCLSPTMCDAYAVICDMSPLRHHRNWVETQAAPSFEGAGVPFYQVDAHNVVPVWIASTKREVGARTLRPKINAVFARYCTQFPEFQGNIHTKSNTETSHKSGNDENGSPQPQWKEIEEYLNLVTSIDTVDGMQGGHKVAMTRFHNFCTSKQHGLKNFDTLRNDPNYSNVCSNLSPWINAGHISFQRLALSVRALKAHTNGTAAYIEEGVVRRELSDNFVYYTPNVYDTIDAAADWARESLDLHTSDVRDHVYTWKELEVGMTHDELWNAAQLQLVREGKMHGFMRSE
jgi:deoxyribodipyrimidine photo-lyase